MMFAPGGDGGGARKQRLSKAVHENIYLTIFKSLRSYFFSVSSFPSQSRVSLLLQLLPPCVYTAGTYTNTTDRIRKTRCPREIVMWALLS
jgi:hypothetical protein